MLPPSSNTNYLVIKFSTLLIKILALFILKFIILLILLISEFKVFIVTDSKLVVVLILNKILILLLAFIFIIVSLVIYNIPLFIIPSTIVILTVLLDLLLFLNYKFKLLPKANINNLLDNNITLSFLIENKLEIIKFTLLLLNHNITVLLLILLNNTLYRLDKLKEFIRVIEQKFLYNII